MILFRHIGHCVGKWPLQVLLVNALIFVPLLSYFLIYPISIVTDIRRGFAHVGGRSAREFAVFGEFYNVSVESMDIILIFVESRDNGESGLPMNSRLLKEVDRLDRYLKQLTVPSLNDPSRQVSFADIQSPRGELNYLFRAFKWALETQEENLAQNRSLDRNLELTYPTSKIWGHSVPLYSHLFNVHAVKTNGSARATDIESAQTIALWYMLEVDEVGMNRAKLQEMELKLFEVSKDNRFSPHFSIHIYGDEVGNYEMMRGSSKCSEMLAVGMVLMLLFMSISLRRFSWRAQLVLVPSAIVSPLFAIATTFAVLGWLGVQFNSVMSIMPFLVLGIGVDDAFLLLHSWQKWSAKSVRMATTDDLGRRMGLVMEEIGPSISITSLTNVLAFGIGVLSPSRIMSSFCLATMVAIGFDFLFELLLFAPCVVLTGRIETKNLRSGKGRSSTVDKMKRWRNYSRFVASNRGKAMCFLSLTLLYTFAFFGVRLMKTSFEPKKSFPSDSALLDSTRVLSRVQVDYTPITFIVNSPPNVSNATEISQFFNLVSSLEALPKAYRPEKRTQLWLPDYLNYDREVYASTKSSTNQSYVPSYKHLPSFLSGHFMDDKHVVNYHLSGAGEVVVDSFVFLLICRGSTDWNERAQFVSEVREIVDSYPKFNVTVFDYDSTIYDLIITVPVELLKAVIITLASMTVVCFFVIPNLKNTAVAILNVVSICFSLLGALGWWDLDYDPVTMITMLMAIGYSVDYSAHICYHHYRMECGLKSGDAAICEKSPDERMLGILSSVGRPMLEAALSTFICMLPLFFVRIYIVSSFAKTCVSVVVLGLYHGIFVLPVLLLLNPPGMFPSSLFPATKPRVLVNNCAEPSVRQTSGESDFPLMPAMTTDHDDGNGRVNE